MKKELSGWYIVTMFLTIVWVASFIAAENAVSYMKRTIPFLSLQEK